MTAEQQAALSAAIAAINTYLQNVNTALQAALTAGDNAAAVLLQQRHDDGLAMLKQAVDMQVTATLADLAVSANTLNAQAEQLSAQVTGLNAIGGAIGSVAAIVTQITTVASTVAALVALV